MNQKSKYPTEEVMKSLKSLYSYDYRTATLYESRRNSPIRLSETLSHLSTGIGTRKLPAAAVAYFLHYGEPIPVDTTVITRDLDPYNISLLNLKVIPKKDWKKIQRLIRNTKKYLRINHHPNDNFKVVVKYLDFELGVLRIKSFNDSCSAKSFVRNKLRVLFRELERLGINTTTAELFINKPRI